MQCPGCMCIFKSKTSLPKDHSVRKPLPGTDVSCLLCLYNIGFQFNIQDYRKAVLLGPMQQYKNTPVQEKLILEGAKDIKLSKRE